MWDLSSLTSDRTSVPCVEKWICNHLTTREVPDYITSYVICQCIVVFCTAEYIAEMCVLIFPEFIHHKFIYFIHHLFLNKCKTINKDAESHFYTFDLC